MKMPKLIHKAIKEESKYIGYGSSNLQTKCGLSIGSGIIAISDSITSYYNGCDKDPLSASKNDKDVTCKKCNMMHLIEKEELQRLAHDFLVSWEMTDHSTHPDEEIRNRWQKKISQLTGFATEVLSMKKKEIEEEDHKRGVF